jgi:hypothetical protein
VFEFGPESGGGPWFFCSPALPRAGHCAGDFDDNGVASIIDQNPAVADVFGRPQTPRPLHCRPDMGADESEYFHWATLDLVCKERTGGTCAAPVYGPDPANCDYCAGDNIVINPVIASNCPSEFRVVQWYRLSPEDVCPPADLANPTGMPVSGGRFEFDPVSGRLCINGALVEDQGCYYAILQRRLCDGTARGRFRACNPDLDPECANCEGEGCCVERIAACVCITIYDAPMFNDQPDDASVCVGGSQTICASFQTPANCDVGTVRWYKKVGAVQNPLVDTLLGTCTIGNVPPCTDNNAADNVTLSLVPGPGGGSDKWTTCLTFSPASLAHAGTYYAVVDCGSALCSRNSLDATLTVYRQPVITVQPQPRAACVSGTQELCLTAVSPDGRPLQIDWFRLSSCGEMVPVPYDPNNPPSNRVCTQTCTPAAAGVPVQYCCTVTAPNQVGTYFYRAVIRVCDPDNSAKCPVVVSDCVTLTVVDPRPCVESRVVCVGGTQCLSVNPASLPTLPGGYTYTFRWFFLGTADCTFPTCATCVQNPGAHGAACSGGTIVNNGGVYSGATTDTLRITNAQLTHRGRYYVQIGLDGPDAGSDPDPGKCMANSNCACLIVVNPQPVVNGATVCETGTQCLELAAPLPALPCDYTYVYQWFFLGTSACTTNANCGTGSCSGGTALSNNARYSGVTTDRLCVTGATAAERGCYYLRVTISGPNSCVSPPGVNCNINSNCACLNVVRQPQITVQPQPRAACVSGTQQLCLTAVSPDGRSLQIDWFRVSSCGAPVPDPTFPNPVCSSACTPAAAGAPVQYCCTVTAPNQVGTYFYRAVIRVCDPDNSAKCPVVVSDCVTLTVVDPRPCVESRVVCVGGTQCLSVNPASLPTLPGGYTYTFRWFFLGTADCTFPTCATCVQNPGAHGAACSGGTIVNNGGVYSGATTDTLRITNAQLTHRGRYYVQIGLDGPDAGSDPDPGKCMANSNCACLIVVNPQPVVNGATVCETGTQCLELAAPLPALPCDYTYEYQWFFLGTSACTTNANCGTGPCSGGTALSNNARYSGVTTDRLCVMGATAAERGCYYLRVTISGPNSCVSPPGVNCSINSNCACLNVIPQPTIAVQPADAYVCLGNQQCLSVQVAYTGTAPLCWQWIRRSTCAASGCPPLTDCVVQSGTWTVGQPLTFPLCVTPTPADPDSRCYFFRVRVCNPDNENKCPPRDSDCACLTVLPPIVPCTLTCPSGLTDGAGNCLFCDRSQISLCCNVSSTTEPLCYQWYYSPTPCAPGTPGCGVPIPGATGQCFEFEFNAQNIGLPCGPGCYFVKINYLVVSNNACDSEPPGKCTPVWSNALCIAETTECCPRECECKDNENPNQPFYALWRTGTWDGANAEWSYDRSSTGGAVIKAADDIYLCPSSMHHIKQFLAEMLVKRENPLIDPLARLRFYTDCNGAPGDLVAEFDSEPCPAFLGSTPEGFNRYQFWFDLTDDCFWLRGGVYWVSVVGIAPPQDVNYEAAWVTAGNPSGGGPRPECGMPPVGACCVGDACTVQTQAACQAASGRWYRGAPCTDFTCGASGRTLLGKRPQMMLNGDPWTEYDPCCHPCDDFVFCVSGESCPIVWDNGKAYLGGADGPAPPAPPIPVFGTRSEKSALPVRDSRAADQFIIKPCQTPEEICYIEGVIFTNCTGFEVHLEIYRNDCDEPDFVLPGGVPFYHTTNVRVEDLGLSGLRVGTTNVRAYRVSVCDFGGNPLVLEGGQNYWISFSVRDSFSTNERAFFAHVAQPCEACDTPAWKVKPGMEIAPGRQIPNWRGVNADFAFLIAAKKRVDHPAAAGVDPERCIADANNDGQIAVDDIFYFLSAFFAGCP